MTLISPPEPRLDPLLQQGFAEPLLESLQARAAAGGRPVVGLNGPVGAGKTSLCRWLAATARARGLELAVASIDDFYLPWSERLQRLAGNPFGVSRVPPGSHDTALLLESLARWQGGGDLCLPRFDKSLRGGQGDRCGQERKQAQAMVLEGWLLGCLPLPAEIATSQAALAAAGVDLNPRERAWLPTWNRALQAYQPIWQLLDGLWLLRPLQAHLPRRWRFQAEARQRRRGQAWLDGKALDGLVRASLASLPAPLYQQPLEPAAACVAWLDARRRCVRLERGAQPSADSSSLVG